MDIIISAHEDQRDAKGWRAQRGKIAPRKISFLRGARDCSPLN